MIYQSTITTPANTTLANPKRTSLKMVVGLIYQFELYFPPGPSGLVGVAIFDTEVQLYPRGRHEFFVGDNTLISFNDLHMLESENATLDIYTYNIDDAYEHQIQARFGIVDRKDFQSSFIPSMAFDNLATTMEEVNETMLSIKEDGVKKPFTLFRPRS